MAENKRFNKIILQSMGTRGDAQPMVAVALMLQDEGHDVTVLTTKDQVDFIESLQLKARPVFMDIQDEMSKGDLAKSMNTGDTFLFLKGLAEANKKHAATTVKQWYEAVTEIKPDLCISGTLADLLGLTMVRHFNIPTVFFGLQPIPENPPKMILGFPNLPCCGLNAFLVRYILGDLAQGELNSNGVELKKQFGIDVSKICTKQDIIETRGNPPPVQRLLLGCDPTIAHVLYGGAEFVPKRVKLVGFLAVDSNKQVNVAKQGEGLKRQQSNQFGAQSALDGIEAFCAEGAPPVYLGFGSMTAKSPEHMVVLLCQGVKHAGARAIICAGWAKLSQSLLEKSTKDSALIEYAKANIMFVGNTPHEWLFPKCSCIVHHGGAGTTCTASRAAVPQIIIPVWLDQWDMAHFLNSYGSGIGCSKQLVKISEQEVGDAIKKVQADEKMKAKAKQWGENALAQRGTTAFLRELNAWWDAEVVTGKWAKHHEERIQAIAP